MRTALILALLLLSSCRSAMLEEHLFYAMGTEIRLSLYDDNRQRIAQAQRAVQDLFVQWEQQFHPWRPGSLMDVNKAFQEQRSIAISDHFRALVQRSQTLSNNSDGLFNPAIGGLIKLWGFQQDDPLKVRLPPAPQAISQWLQRQPAMADLRLDGDHISSINSAVQLDFGGIAKGYAIAESLRLLRQHQISAAIVNAGGDLGTIGQPGNRRWRIGIRHPDRQRLIGWLEARPGESLFSSGSYERFFNNSDRRYHHILDPRSGYPALAEAVTVVHQDPVTADAAATALLVAGAKQWPRIARQMGVSEVLLMDQEGHIHGSEKMLQRLRWSITPAKPPQLQPL